jgi:hypothetical protein
MSENVRLTQIDAFKLIFTTNGTLWVRAELPMEHLKPFNSELGIYTSKKSIDILTT